MSTTETLPLSELLALFTASLGETEREGTKFTYAQSETEIAAFAALDLDTTPALPQGTPVEFMRFTGETDEPYGNEWVVVKEPGEPDTEAWVVHFASLEFVEQPTEEQAETDPTSDMPGDKPSQVASPITPGRIYSHEEIQAIIDKDKRQAELARVILNLESEALGLQADLNDLRGRIKEKHKELAEMAVAPAQTRIDFGGKPEDDDRDPAILTPGERGAQAASQGKDRDECPYGNDYPEWREQWLAAFDAANAADARSWKGKENEMLMSRAKLTMDQCASLLAATDKLIWPASGNEIPKLSTEQREVALFDRPHLVIDELGLSEGLTGRKGYVLAPLYTADEWTASGADIGDPVDRSTQPGFHDYQIHGVLCGRRVKSGAKKLIIGPERDFIHLVADEQPSEEADVSEDEGLLSTD